MHPVPIVVNLDEIMCERGVSGCDLAQAVGVSPVNISKLRRGHVRAIRFSLLEALCIELDCQPGDILTYEKGLP